MPSCRLCAPLLAIAIVLGLQLPSAGCDLMTVGTPIEHTTLKLSIEGHRYYVGMMLLHANWECSYWCFLGVVLPVLEASELIAVVSSECHPRKSSCLCPRQPLTPVEAEMRPPAYSWIAQRRIRPSPSPSCASLRKRKERRHGWSPCGLRLRRSRLQQGMKPFWMKHRLYPNILSEVPCSHSRAILRNCFL